MTKQLIAIASANGFLAVALGAFGAHSLESLIAPSLLNTYNTAVEYHMYHALALFGTALLSIHYPNEKLLSLSACLFVLGILFFSGSLYILSLSEIRWCGATAPIGGGLFLAGWGVLVWFGLRSVKPGDVFRKNI